MAKYLLYYAGFNRADGLEQIGVAISDDLVTWTRPQRTPIITTGSCGIADKEQTSNPCVLRIGSEYRMWYQGRGSNDQLSICHAISNDGIHWSVRPGPVLKLTEPTTGHRLGYQHPHVIYNENRRKFLLWCAFQRDGVAKLLYGESSDGIDWQMNSDPVFEASAEWQGTKILYPCIRRTENGFAMWYTGRNRPYEWGIGYAESVDGTRWSGARRLLPIKDQTRLSRFACTSLARARIFPNSCLDAYGTASPCVWREHGVLRMLAHDVGPAGKLSISIYESVDNSDWTRVRQNILDEGHGRWDSFFQADPYLIII